MFNHDQRPLYEVKANLFKGLAHPLRIRVLEILSASSEASVGDMLADTEVEASHLSQHLAVLRRYGLVVSDRRANEVYYQLTSRCVTDLLNVARRLLIETLEGSREELAKAHELPVFPTEESPDAGPSDTEHSTDARTDSR